MCKLNQNLVEVMIFTNALFFGTVKALSVHVEGGGLQREHNIVWHTFEA